MSKNLLSESETLDEKIKRIRKKNEEIEKRRLEVEADKQSAAKLNALVQLSSPKEDWPPPRSYISEENTGRPSYDTQEKFNKERNRGTITFDNSLYEGKRPPPDPAYKFLADAERDPVPNKTSTKYQQIKQGRGRAAPRSRGRGNRANIRDDPPLSERGTPGYVAWRAERNRIDEERIRRQRTAQGQWRREWDNQKSEGDWQTPNKDGRREQNEAQNNRITSLNAPLECTQRKFMPHNQVSEEGFKKDLANKKFGRNSDLPPDVQFNSLSSNADKPLKPAISLNASQNSGNTLRVSFVNDECAQKAPSVRHITGSGRLGPPPVGPPRDGGGVEYSEARPQRRVREARRRRRAPAAIGVQKKVSAGDDSWEDADEPSEGEDNVAASPAKPTEDRTELLQKVEDEESKPSRVSGMPMTFDSYSSLPGGSSSFKSDDGSYPLPHCSIDTSLSQNSDHFSVESQTADCPTDLLHKNLSMENIVGIIGKENSRDETETITIGVGITSVIEGLPVKVLERVDEPDRNSSPNEGVNSTESTALKNDGTDVAQDFHFVVSSVDNNEIVDCSIVAAIETRAANEGRDPTVEISDENPKSSMISDDKLSALSQDEVQICGDNAESENTSYTYQPCEEMHSVQRNTNISESSDINCTVLEKSETICDGIEGINLSDKENLTINKNFSAADVTENKDDSTNVFKDLSQDHSSEAKKNDLISDNDQIPQPNCPTSDILVNTSQDKETRDDQNQNSAQDLIGNTDTKLSTFDKAEINSNVMGKSSTSTPEEN